MTVRKVLVPIVAILIFLVFWELLVWVNQWPDYKMASPSDLGPAFWQYKSLFFVYGWQTLWRAVAGLPLAFMISFFPIAVSDSIGLSTLEPECRDILRALGASKFMIFRKIALPKTLPESFGALKAAVTLAFIGNNGGDHRTAWSRAGTPFRQCQDQFRLPADVCCPDSTGFHGYRALLRACGTGADVCGMGGAKY